jgi:hypothetical protein
MMPSSEDRADLAGPAGREVEAQHHDRIQHRDVEQLDNISVGGDRQRQRGGGSECDRNAV